MRNIVILSIVALWSVGCDDSAQSVNGQDGAIGRITDGGQVADSGVRFIDAGDRRPDDDPGQGGDPPSDLCLNPPEPIPQPSIDLQSRCRDAGEPIRIRDLRDPRCPDAPIFRDADRDGMSDERVDAELTDVVVSAIFDDAFVVQDPDGGTFSGLWIFDRQGAAIPRIEPGTRLRIRGQLLEFYTLTELQLAEDGDGFEILGQGQPPQPVVVMDPSRIANGGDLAEALESVLVELRSVSVRNTAPDCPRDFDMFVISGGLRIEDEVGLSYEPARGDFITSVVGVLHFSFDHQKVIPRSDSDLDLTDCGGIPDKCDATECVEPVGAPETGEMVITEVQDDPRGRDTDREFIELFNATDVNLNLDGWWVQNCADNRVALSGNVRPGERFVLAGSLNRNDNGGVSADLELGDLPLSNGSGSLLLFNASGALVDQVRYESMAPWPSRESGHSLHLLSPRADNSNGASWRSSAQEYGDGGWGSPGR